MLTRLVFCRAVVYAVGVGDWSVDVVRDFTLSLACEIFIWT
jgi:hypothetical protein